MELILKRTRLGELYTTGQLYIDGEYFCFTLEDKVREIAGKSVKEWKIPKGTAIPSGMYIVTFENSPKFGPDTLTINDVPGFTGVRIHTGNTHLDTDGCPIVGYRITEKGVIVPGTTKTCLIDLKRRLKEAKDTIKIRIF